MNDVSDSDITPRIQVLHLSCTRNKEEKKERFYFSPLLSPSLFFCYVNVISCSLKGCPTLQLRAHARGSQVQWRGVLRAMDIECCGGTEVRRIREHLVYDIFPRTHPFIDFGVEGALGQKQHWGCASNLPPALKSDWKKSVDDWRSKPCIMAVCMAWADLTLPRSQRGLSPMGLDMPFPRLCRSFQIPHPICHFFFTLYLG